MTPFLRGFVSAGSFIGVLAIVAAMLIAPAESAIAILIVGGLVAAAIAAAVAWESLK